MFEQAVCLPINKSKMWCHQVSASSYSTDNDAQIGFVVMTQLKEWLKVPLKWELFQIKKDIAIKVKLIGAGYQTNSCVTLRCHRLQPWFGEFNFWRGFNGLDQLNCLWSEKKKIAKCCTLNSFYLVMVQSMNKCVSSF